MAIPLPNLDDRRFSDLVAELRALIPRYAPEWTDHNISDPGITLVELFSWLAEALMYRMNRVPVSSEARFLELLGARFHSARPAMVPLTITAAGLTGEVLLPRGTPLTCAPPMGGSLLPFETLRDLHLGPDAPTGMVNARQTLVVTEEALGVSSGDPHQLFPVQRPFLTVEVIPEVTVGGERWTFVENLLDSNPEDRHFSLEPRLSAVRFGDDRLGEIPEPGAELRATYTSTFGAAGNVPAGATFAVDDKSPRLAAQIREAVVAGVSFAFSSQTAASGGSDPTSLEEAREAALRFLKERWRAITAADFEGLVLGGGFELARARCVPERDLTASDPHTPRPGHVSMVIVPDLEAAKPTPTADLVQEVWALLDQRRLVTCRHHVVGPGYTDVRIRARVVREREIQDQTVRGAILENLEAFFHPLTGGPGPEQQGWPFGRSVFISEVYEVLEGTSGVDHVEFLTLCTRDEEGGWTDGAEEIPISPHHLVAFDGEASEISIEIGREG